MRHYLTFMLLFFAGITASGENYPYRSDFLWVATPSHADWVYRTGEPASVEVQLYHYGVPVSGVQVSYAVSDDMQRPAGSKTAMLRGGKATIAVGTRRTPGFLDVSLSAEVDGQRTTHHTKVGFSPEAIKPAAQLPADFDTFWQQTVAEARQTPLEVVRTRAEQYCTDKIDCWLVRLRTTRTHYIYGYLTMPRGAQAGSCPAVLCPPGAGVKTIKEPLRHRYYAEQGMIRFEVEIHGLNPEMSEQQFREVSLAFGGYTEFGIESRERYYMRQVYVSMVRALDYLVSLPEYDGRGLAVQGGSQGGALTLVAAALDSRVRAACANHPALTDMSTIGWPHFRPEVLTPAAVRTLAYYDVVNFCRRVSCPVRMTWGYNDSTCPPTTSYAAYNTLACPKTAVITPVNEHWTSDTMERQHCQWIAQQLRAASPDDASR